MGEVEPTFTIENMTLTAQLSGVVDLDEVAASFKQARFDPDKFPGVEFRLRDPKVSINIFSTGKLVCIGARSYAEGKRAFHRLVALFADRHGLERLQLKGRPQVKNVFAKMSLGIPLDLDVLSSHFEGSNYDPTEFPGLMVRLNGSAIATLYGTGNAIITGVDSVERMREFVNSLWDKVHSLSTGANIVGSEQN
ncbi:MAG: hypothetical protein ACTSR9_19265 [Candidatus Thorarchaeota archaeon]